MRDQGSEVNSPRQAFKAAFKLGWIKDELIWDQIIRERNLAVHTYSQELAETVYAEIPKLKCAFIELRENLQKVYPFDWSIKAVPSRNNRSELTHKTDLTTDYG